MVMPTMRSQLLNASTDASQKEIAASEKNEISSEYTFSARGLKALKVSGQTKELQSYRMLKPSSQTALQYT